MGGFHVSLGYVARVHTVHTVQRGGHDEHEVRAQAVDVFSDLPPEELGVRWIHVPTNDLVWVNEWFEKCTQAPMDPEISTMKTRPSFSQRSEATRSAERIWPEHAKHLEPSCTQGSEFRGAVPIPLRSSRQEAPGEEILALRGIDPLPPLTVYLPYMSWMEYGDYLLTKDTHKQLTRDGYAERQRYYLADFGTPQAVDGSRSWPMMTSPEVIANQKYPRRTLDQFYYPALHDTSVRDKDQTVSKWTGAALGLDGKEEAGTDSLLIIIDQFWCWIINKNTILTSFPSGSYSAPPTDVQDLYQSIIESLARDPKEMKSVADMYLFLTRKVVGYMFSQANRNLVDLVEIYRWVTSKKAATQTSYFQEFQQGYASGGDDNTIFNDRRDLKLVLDVADIIDELKMIEHLFSIQKEIIESSVKALGMDYLVSLNLMKETVDPLIHQITSISKDAEHTRKMLLNLLDLKSNAASLAEARSSAKEAQAATTQGRAVMLFTIITVVFLPLSFFTSYFGQNVKELTGDENNPTSWDLWRVATPITVVVIVVALFVAFYITRPKSLLWFWQAAPKQGAAVEQETMATGTKRVKWWQRRPSFTFLNSKREKGKNGDPELTVV